MSLESALAEENNSILNRLGPIQNRGRSSHDRSMSPHGQLRSTSRGRGRGLSTDRRATSRARSQGEDVNYRWSILFHDPSERFVSQGSITNTDVEDLQVSQGVEDEDDISEEEQISDDDEDFDYDINDLKLPNFKMSINDYYKGKAGKVSKEKPLTNRNQTTTTTTTTTTSSASQAATRMVNKMAKNLNLSHLPHTLNEEHEIKKEGEKIETLSQVLALEKGLEDAKDLGNKVPKETLSAMSKRLNDIGFESGKLSVQDLIKLENAKDHKYEEYKKTLMGESKDEIKEKKKNNDNDNDNLIEKQDERIVTSSINFNEESLRVSRSITLGKFFIKNLKNETINSYLLYMDLSSESINSLQYTLGTVVKSGDVLYIINSVNDETNINFFEKQISKITKMIIIYLNLIKNSNFKLHIIIECLNQSYPKHFLNELIKYLKPKLLIVCYKLIFGDGELNNYISTIPLMIVKRKASKRRRSVGV